VANPAWRILAGSNAQCEQCNHTHTDSQHCECYRIVVQPMQPLLHGAPPCSASLVSEKAAEITSRAALSSALQKGGRPRDRYGSRPATPVLRRAADCRRHLVMNSFRPTPTMAHVTIAVALVGAAITIGLTIWESQKGKTRGPVIIDDQFVSHRQR